MNKIRQNTQITNYFGYLTVLLEWLGGLLCIAIHPINLAEPFSQYGIYSDTKVVFGILFTIAAVVYYLFSININSYWKYTSKVTLLAGTAFIVTGWYAYTPQAKSFLLDIHNVAITLAIICYALPMIFVSYTASHQKIARLSRVLFVAIIGASIISVVARITNIDVVYSQLIMLVITHIWIIMISYLHTQHGDRIRSLL